MSSHFRKAALALCAGGVVLAGCGGDDEEKSVEAPPAQTAPAPPAPKKAERKPQKRQEADSDRRAVPKKETSPVEARRERVRRFIRELRRNPKKLAALRRRIMSGNVAPGRRFSREDLRRYMEGRRGLPGNRAPAEEPSERDRKRYEKAKKKALGG